MSDEQSFRSLWAKMSLPPHPDATTIRPIPRTNAYLSKNYDNSIGLFLRDVTDQLPKRRFKHLDIILKPSQNLSIPKGGNKTLYNCLILQADNEIKAPLLSLILDCLHDLEPTGEFTASNLISVLDDVEELMRKPKSPPTREEVAGVWGELYVLRLLLNNSITPVKQYEIVKGWEGETREKLDFRFLFAKQVLEIKSTTSKVRIHHLHGIEQVTIPPGFENGAMASLILETGQGSTNLMMVSSIVNCFKGSIQEKRKCSELLEKRMLLRGEACNDERFPFDLAPNGLHFFDFENVPTPGEAEGVTPIEWLSDLTNSEAFTSSDTDDLISMITHSN